MSDFAKYRRCIICLHKAPIWSRKFVLTCQLLVTSFITLNPIQLLFLDSGSVLPVEVDDNADTGYSHYHRKADMREDALFASSRCASSLDDASIICQLRVVVEFKDEEKLKSTDSQCIGELLCGLATSEHLVLVVKTDLKTRFDFWTPKDGSYSVWRCSDMQKAMQHISRFLLNSSKLALFRELNMDQPELRAMKRVRTAYDGGVVEDMLNIIPDLPKEERLPCYICRSVFRVATTVRPEYLDHLPQGVRWGLTSDTVADSHGGKAEKRRVLGRSNFCTPRGSMQEHFDLTEATTITEWNNGDSTLMEDDPKEKCGIFGIYAPELDGIGRLISLALIALQHRGQESCGIVTQDNMENTYFKAGVGLVTQVFTEVNLKEMKGHMGVGHTRYSTAGGSSLNNAQPSVVHTYHGKIAVAENGNITTQKKLRREILKGGIAFQKESDIEVITQCIAANPVGVDESNGPNWEARLKSFMQKTEGAYSLAIQTPDGIYGCRDCLGMRPLSIGVMTLTKEDGGEVQRYCIASETCALNLVGASYLREVQPGEIIRIDEDGLHSSMGRESVRQALCIFEYVYLARPDSYIEDQLVYSVRQRLGRQLAKESPIDADVVIGVPDSSLQAAMGYAQESGIPYLDGLMKNRYIYRTFIQPTQKERKSGIDLKFNPLVENIRGKRVVLVDDSIVRGNTLAHLLKVVRNAGAKEVHVRISSPPLISPCFMGIDFATTDQLVAHNKTNDEICQIIGADTLAYLTNEGLESAVKAGLPSTQKGGYCGACFTGQYPLEAR
ncbi:hypothetical protein PROFUN_08866 [Planoprotostelium fungivorum]|uniref:amidophosphoribosyltransferase n=1 Tax=Planoprotostelium fungivorum TaxID=1890364 RepID=A0A2P6NJ25_9EUKA|nr:hypothetical protein PROFUN_08866 [Planoprotostelium fungivorum]